MVKNGSVGLKVIGLGAFAGSGSFAMSSSISSCQKQNAIAITRTTPEKMIRLRSSSRCSTSVRRSSNLAGFIGDGGVPRLSPSVSTGCRA